jgi:hypothetical protein
MAIHTHTSWGKTRGPKNITGTIGAVVSLEANTNNMLGSASGYKLVGYASENQRWLHVLAVDPNNDDGHPGAITVFGYCHAFERWFEIGASTMDYPISAANANVAPTAASITVANDIGDVDGTAQVPSDREYRRYDILGIDRVAFVGDDDLSNVYAACSTF